jgi:dihydrofolate reductase
VSLALIWAQAENGVIGADGRMPWHLPEDLAHFKELTLGAPVVMGRRTWDSLTDRFRPLPGRRNIVVTRAADWVAEGADVARSLDAALTMDAAPTTWIIGGAQLYAATIARADRLEVTDIAIAPSGDAFAPAIDRTVWSPTRETADAPWLTSRTGLEYRFVSYTRAARPAR